MGHIAKLRHAAEVNETENNEQRHRLTPGDTVQTPDDVARRELTNRVRYGARIVPGPGVPGHQFRDLLTPTGDLLERLVS